MKRYNLAQITILYMTRIEQENNVDDDFTEDVRTFLISYSLSTLDKSFRGFQRYSLITNYVDG